MPQHSKRDDLMSYGLQHVHRHGFLNSGVASIAEAAGAPKGSFYNHFSSKDDFGREIINSYLDSDRVALARLAQDSTRPALDRLIEYFVALRDGAETEAFADGCLLGNMAGEIADEHQALRAPLIDVFDEWSELITVLVSQGHHDGSINKTFAADQLARVLIDAWQGARLQAKLRREATPFDRFFNVVLTSLAGPPARSHPPRQGTR
jgi:TetR/AcrR family transcriptional regulator, transcriptional repressor for nem operon